MLLPNREFSLSRSLVVSLVIHVVVLGVFVGAHHHAEQVKTRERLVVELFGMLSNRQAEEKHLGEAVSRMGLDRQSGGKTVRRAEKPLKKAAERKDEATGPVQHESLKRMSVTQAESPVKVAMAAEQDKQAPHDAQRMAVQGTNEQQKQQMISHAGGAMDPLQRYSVQLRKAIKAKLVYPKDAKRAGLTGAPVIMFRVVANGAIEAGSLVIRRSSGHAVLDEQALRAARAAAPFPPPPKPMVVALDIGFFEDRR